MVDSSMKDAISEFKAKYLALLEQVRLMDGERAQVGRLATGTA